MGAKGTRAGPLATTPGHGDSTCTVNSSSANDDGPNRTRHPGLSARTQRGSAGPASRGTARSSSTSSRRTGASGAKVIAPHNPKTPRRATAYLGHIFLMIIPESDMPSANRINLLQREIFLRPRPLVTEKITAHLAPAVCGMLLQANRIPIMKR